MTGLTFIHTKEFDKQWNLLNLDDECLRTLQNELIGNPRKGDVIQGTNGVRKIRINFPNRGKRGSGRVCYVNFLECDSIYLITVYSKNEKSDLTPSEKSHISEIVTDIESNL